MKKADRSKHKASSSARAAQLLSESVSSRPAGTAFGFGGYSGCQQLQVSSPGPRASDTLSPGGELEGSIGQHLRRLAKRDPTTRLKALQALKPLLVGLPPAEIEPVLLAWTPTFQRLVMDNVRTVRMEACSIMGVLAPKAGRSLVRALKSLLGPWCLAQADSHPDTAKNAGAAFRDTFPGPKAREAVALFRNQVLDYLEENLRATPEALGDMHKETPEERAERYERVLASSLAAMRNLLDVMLPKEASAPRDEAGQELVTRVKSILVKPGMLKQLLSSKSPIPVRSACCALIALLCKRAPDALHGPEVAQLAPLILGFIDEKDAAVHLAMWDMMLSFGHAYPDAWLAVNARKVVLPRLMALLRNACYGSAEVSFPAVLPFVAQMPKDLLGPDPSVISQLLASIWHGWEVAGTQGTARAAAAESYMECLTWTFAKSTDLTGGDQMGYLDVVLDRAFDGQALRAALGQTRASTSAAEIVLELTRAVGNKGDAHWGVELIVAHIGRVLGQSLAANDVPPHKYEKALKLLQGLHGLSSISARVTGGKEKLPTVFEAAIHPVTLAIMANLGSQKMSGPAAKLLSQVMHWQEGWDTKAAVSVIKVLGAFVAGPAEGQDAEALADLILAALQQSEDPRRSLSTVISALLLPKPTGTLANGHGIYTEVPSEHASADSQQGHVLGMHTELHSTAYQEAATISESAVIGRSTLRIPEGSEGRGLPEASDSDILASQSGQAADSSAPASPNNITTNRTPSVPAGRLDYLCTLLCRMSAQDEQAQAKSHLWQAEPLGVVSKHLTKPEVLLSDPHAPKALALLLRGDGTHPFLSPKAVSDACEDLLPMLEHGAIARSYPHIPCSPMCQSAQRRHRAQLLAQAVLHVLDLCLFSSAVMLLPTGQGHTALWLLCTVYRLACLPESRARHGMNSPPELAFIGAPGEEEEPVALEATARDVWEGGYRLADLSSQSPQAFRFQVQESLLHVLQRHVASLTPDQAQDAEEVDKCVAAARSIMNAACQEEADRDDLIEGLLAPRKGWPRYMMPSVAVKGKEASGRTPEAAAAAGKAQMGDPDAQGHFMPAFALALGAELGFAPLLQPSQGLPRSWLVVELLCFCEEEGLQQEAVALCTYLAGREPPGGAPATSSDPLVEATLTRLWDHITVPYLHESKQHVPYKALCKLLPDLINGSDLAAMTAASLLRTRLSQLEGTDFLLELLQSIAPALRCRTDGTGAALSAFAIAQMKMALRQAPLMSALSDAPDRFDGTLASLRTVTACFPLAGVTGKEPAASSEEADLLRQLAAKQLKAERSARAAMAASRRLAPESSAVEERSSDMQAEAEGVIAELQLSTVLYCWRQLSQDEWPMIMHRAQESTAALAVLLEDQAEAVIAAAQRAATVLAQQQATVKPDVAVAILQRLGRLRTPEASAKLEPAAGEMQCILDDPARRQKLQMHLPWLEILALVLQRQSSGESLAGFPLLGQSAKLDETIPEALRVVWAGGVAAAVALSCSSVGAVLAEQLVDGNAELWEAASTVLEAALSNQAYLTESIQALDTWAADTGVKAVSAAVALLEASVSHDAMHSTALRLVLSPGILPQIAQLPPHEEADEEASAGPVEEDTYEILISGGVHPLLAARAADTALPEAFVLAWSLLLACMMDSSHDRRRRLGLTCGHVDSLTAELLSMLVAVLPLEEAQKASKAKHAAKHGMAPSPVQAAAAAAAARAAGTDSSLSKEMLRLGVPENDDDWEGLAAAVYRAVLQMLPASAMSWFGSLRDRSLALATEAYTALRESPSIIAAELAGVSGAGFQGNENSSSAEFRVRASVALREASATLCIEDNATLEMTIKLPASWPLRPAEVECKRKVGVTEGRLRKWLLSIAAFLRSQNGGLTDAMRLWRDNCVREFAGVEECLICYSVIAAQDGQLPRMICSTCSKGFHRACLYKWFRSSHKSVCPHCQSPW